MDTDIERFTGGDCFILAKALHRLTGWPLYSFHDGGYPGDPGIHAFVVMPDGRALDVEGPCKFSAMCEKWDDENNVCEFPYNAFRFGTAFGRYSYHRAKIVAGRLLENL